MKRIITIVIAMIMMFSAVQIAYADDTALICSGTAGDGITWDLTEDGTLTVRGNGPIVDDSEVETDEDGTVSVNKLNCISWQVNDKISELTEDFGYAEIVEFRYNFVKKLVIEEGITEIPEYEFDDIYPRTVILPSTLEKIGNSAIIAEFSESLTVKSRTLSLKDGIRVSAYVPGAKPYATIDDGIRASVKHASDWINLEDRINPVYDLGTLLEIQNEMTGIETEEFLTDFNKRNSVNYETLDECAELCITQINDVFSTDYKSADEVYTLVTEDDYQYLRRDSELDTMISDMEYAIDISDRLTNMTVGEETNLKAYQWLTVYAPGGSKAQSDAEGSGLPFSATEPAPEDTSFLGRVKRFFADIAESFRNLFQKIVSFFNINNQ
ncbi:MAG: hypothetical protein IKH65_05335 [Clostridia bacterium]|nr:hypothetical protein [Clostridia bacterium]